MPNPVMMVDLSKISEPVFGIHWRRYRQMAKDDIVPEVKAGKIDLIEATRCLIAYYRKRAEGDGDASLTDERKRKTTAEADIAEMERDEMSGLLMRRAEVDGEFVKRMVILRTDLMALPKRLAKWPDAKEIADKAARQMLKNYSRPSGVLKNGKK